MLNNLLNKNKKEYDFGECKIVNLDKKDFKFYKYNQIEMWVNDKGVIYHILTKSSDIDVIDSVDCPKINDELTAWINRFGDIYECEEDVLYFLTPIKDYDIFIEIERKNKAVSFNGLNANEWNVVLAGLQKHDPVYHKRSIKIVFK